MDVEEFGSAPVEADALALIELGFSVFIGNTLLRARLGESSR